MFNRSSLVSVLVLAPVLYLAAIPNAFAQSGQTWITQKITQTTTGYLASPVASDGTTLIAAGGFGPAFFTHTTGVSWGGIQFIGFDPGTDGCNAAILVTAAVVGSTAVGALGSQCNAGVAGKMVVFTRAPASGSWMIAQTIQAPRGAIYFGDNFAFNGDVLATFSGNGILIYQYVNGAWVVTQTLANQACNYPEMAISGQYLIVGQPANSGSGHACIYKDTNGTWALQQELSPANGDTEFGAVVAISGDTALVSTGVMGCPCNADVYTNESGTWVETQTISLTGTAYVGLAVQGNRMMIGNTNGLDTVTYYTRSGPGGTWSPVANFSDSWTNPQDPSQDAGFGYSLAFAGPSLVIGTDYEMAIYSYTQASVSLAASGASSVKKGAQFTVQAIATNSATSASPALTLDVPVPTGAALDSATAVGGTCSTSASQASCSIDPIAANGGTATVNVTLTATGSAGTSVTTTASIQDSDPSVSASTTASITSGGGGGGGGGAFSPLALLTMIGLAMNLALLRKRHRAFRGGS